MEIHHRVTQIMSWVDEDRVWLYLIRGKKIAIIDTGTSQSPQNDITPVLRDMGLTLADITLILNTHGHFDHTGGNAAIKSASNAQILIHPEEVMFLEDHEKSFEVSLKPLIELIIGREHLEEEKLHILEMSGAEVAVDRQINDNDIIDLGDGCELRVIHIPGHSPGSVGFYWEKEGMLFSGDMFSGLGESDGGLPIIGDPAAYKRSVERVQQLPIELILHGHDFRGLTLPPSPVKQRDEVRQYLRDCYELIERLDEAVRRIAPNVSGKPFLEIYDQVIGLLPEEMGFKPASQIDHPLFSAMTVLSCLKEVDR